jgi:hypothetical protein
VSTYVLVLQTTVKEGPGDDVAADPAAVIRDLRLDMAVA